MSFDLKVNLDFKPSCYYKEGNIKFDPPIYLQRYCFVSKVLGHDAFKGKIKKVRNMKEVFDEILQEQ